MQNNYGDKGLVVVAVNLDDPTNKKSRDEVIHLLNVKKLTLTNFALQTREDVMQVATLWSPEPALPLNVVFDRQCKPVKQLVGSGNDKELNKVVQELLDKK